MEFSLQDAALLLRVPERKVRRWVDDGLLPAYRVGHCLCLNRDEVLQWALARGIEVSSACMTDSADGAVSLAAAMEAGGVFHDLAAGDAAAALRETVTRLPLPADTDRDYLHQALLAREAMGSTGVGQGIAIPHVRNPIILAVDAPFVALCFLRTPVDFGAVDGVKVSVLFTVVSPTVRAHLRLLTMISQMLKDRAFMATLRRAAPAPEILTAVRATEEKFAASAQLL